MEDKNSQQCYFAWENLQRGFCYCSYSSFRFCIFNLFLIFICRFSSFICFSTSSFTLPWTIAGFLHPCYNFSPAHRRVIIFNHSVIFLLRALRFWVSIFYPQAFFTLRSFTDILPALIKAFPGSKQFFLEVCRTSSCRSSNTDLIHLFVWFTAIHNTQKNSFLNSTKYYHELLVVKA